MIKFDVIGLKDAQKFLKNAEKQALFATARTLNDCADAVVDYTVNTLLPEKFTLRSKGRKWWMMGNAFGVKRLKRALRKQQPMEAIAGTRAPWMVLQEEGGQKFGRNQRLPVAIAERSNLVRSEKAAIPNPLRPEKLLASGEAFRINTAAGPALYRRVRPGPEFENIKLLYFLRSVVQVKARFDFFARNRKAVEEKYDAFYEKRFAQAMATAKTTSSG